jgi:selenide,water dikinase
MEHEIKLTSFSSGAGCGCKISPSVLQDILKTDLKLPQFSTLLVGNATNDDAAVIDIGNGNALISTTDFFMPVVDDAFSFGRIAAANAISDVYAMGGKPALAIAILGWPIDDLPAALAQRVLDGARTACQEANIPLAGGHSIHSKEPIFGLSVNGFVRTDDLKRNNTAQPGDLLFLTKPIGVGILSTAQKRGLINSQDAEEMLVQMQQLNDIGERLGQIAGVTAMTDITGFGLLGHVIEMADGSNLTADLNYSAIPVLDSARPYLAQRVVPDATYRNWNSYSTRTKFDQGVNVMEAFNLLPDPQTNGGLLVAATKEAAEEVSALLREANCIFSDPIGRMIEKQTHSAVIHP